MINISLFSDKKTWDNELEKFGGGDFYHTWDFHNVSEMNGEGTAQLYVISSERTSLFFPLLSRYIPGTQYQDLTSVYGYPSFLYSGSEVEEFKLLWQFFLKYLKGCGYVSLFSRLNPFLVNVDLMECVADIQGRIVYIDLGLTEEEQWKAYRNNHRRDIKKLGKLGVKCSHFNGVDGDLTGFIDNYNMTMQRLGAEDYYYFSEGYYQSLLSSKTFNSRVYTCSLDEEVICGGIFLFCGDFVQYHLGGTNLKYANLAPSKLMFDQVRRDAVELGYKKFVLGGGVGGKEDALFKFKSGFSDNFVSFGVIREVINEDVYIKLCEDTNGEACFFPRYRTKL